MFNIISYNIQKYEHYHGVRLVVKSKEEFTVIELMQNNNNNTDKFKEEFTNAQHFKRLFERTLPHVQDFANIQTSSETISSTTAYWRRKERLYSFVDSNWDLKQEVVLIQVSYDQYTELQELKSFGGTKIQNTIESH